MNWFEKLVKNQKGVFIVFTAVLLPVIFACAGLAMDLGNAFAHRSKLQNAADAAVLVYGRIDYPNNNKNPDNAKLYMAANDANGHMDKITERQITTGGDDNSVLLSLYASENVPTTFMRILGFENMPVSVVATCKVTTKKVSADSGVFKYAFIAGDDKDSYHCGNKPSFFVSNNGHRIEGPVHLNGAVGLSDNIDYTGRRNVFVDYGKFSTSLPDDLHLWSGGRGAGATEEPRELHQHDIPLGSGDERITPPPKVSYDSNNTHLYQYRFAYYNGTAYGEDVWQGNSPYGTQKIDISLSKKNTETNVIYDFVEDLRLNYKPPKYENEYGGPRDVYIRTNGQYDDTYNSYTNAADNIWGFQYHTFIADGDVKVYHDQIRWDKQPVVIISLHGDVYLSPDESIKALIYAPNGTIYYGNKPNTTFEGSMVGKYIDLNVQSYNSNDFSIYKWNDFGFPNLNRDGSGSSGSGGTGGSTGGDSGSSTVGKVTLHADKDSNYGTESTLWNG